MRSFNTTSPQPPSVTVSGFDPAGTSAVIRAHIDPHADAASAYAICRTPAGVLVSTQATVAITSGNPVDVTFTFRGLQRESAYLFDVIASNPTGDTHSPFFLTTLSNAPPTADNAAGYVVPGGTAFITLPIGDADGDPITFAIETPPAFGSITYFDRGFIYLAGADFPGEDSFTYVVRDNFGAEARNVVALFNPFLESAGSYNAALVRNSARIAEGILKITVGRQGTFTGELRTQLASDGCAVDARAYLAPARARRG